MSSFHQFFSVNHDQLLGLLKSDNAQALSDRIIEAIAKEFAWEDEARKGAGFIREACERVVQQGQDQCENCGWIYFGLMLLCEYERLDAEGWKVQYTYGVADYVNGTSVPDYVKDIFNGLVKGRDPYFNLMDREVDDVVCCFISADEAKRLSDAIDACEDFGEGKIPDSDTEEIIFNEFLPALDCNLAEGHSVTVFTL